DPVPGSKVALDAIHRPCSDLHDIHGSRAPRMLADEMSHGAFVPDDVLAPGVVGCASEQSPQVHQRHVRVFPVSRVMADESDRGIERSPVIVDVERTHEDTYHELWLVDILAQDVRDRCTNALLDCDDFLRWGDCAHVDDGAVGRAQDACVCGRPSSGIAEEPDPAPEQVSRRRAGSRERGENDQARRPQAPSLSTRTMATPEENGKSITSKSSWRAATIFSQRFTPACRTNSRTYMFVSWSRI